MVSNLPFFQNPGDENTRLNAKIVAKMPKFDANWSSRVRVLTEASHKWNRRNDGMIDLRE